MKANTSHSISRRDLLPLLVLATGLPALVYSFVWPPKLELRRLKPRFRKPPIAPVPLANLMPGSYISERRKVVHAVGTSGRVLGVRPAHRNRKGRLTFDWLKNLQPFGLADIPQWNIAETQRNEASPARANLHTAEAMFEVGALERLRAKDVAGASQLLVKGIEHCNLLASRRRSRIDRTGLRLCDLLAGLGARHGAGSYISEAINTIASGRFGPPENRVVAVRLAKWKNPNSKWYKDWQSPRKKWAGLLM